MRKPLVAIVGRPNVGKSTFFNKIVGRKISIVENKPGVTRDRLYYDTEWCGYNFTMVDTGGLEMKSDDQMWNHIKAQTELAVEIADVIVFFVDGQEGVVASDYDVAKYLRNSKKPIVLAVNKLDNNEQEKTYEFYNLGIGEPIGISAEQSKGLGEVLDEIVKNLPKFEMTDDEKEIINIAVVGRPNAGKSSIVNKLLGYERVIVSDIAGTTRDAVDTPFEYYGQKFNIIDTAGMRRKRSIEEEVEYYSVLRAKSAIKRADVVLIVIDSSEQVTEQDIRICGYVHEEGKPSVVVMNKWDAVDNKDSFTINKFETDLKEDLKFMDYFVSVYVSALTGQRLEKIMKEVMLVHAESCKRITTGTLNDVIQDAVSVNEPPSNNGKRLKIFYATQVAVQPPVMVIFVNDESILHFSYLRYLENIIRKAFEFRGTPIKLLVRNKNETDFGFKK